MNLESTRFLALTALVVGVAASFPSPTEAQRLPIFELAAPEMNREKAGRLFEELVSAKNTEKVAVMDTPGVFGYRDGNRRVEMYKASGGIFLADLDQLWNPEARPDVPEQASAREVADRFLSQHDLLPPPDDRLRVSFLGYSETGVSDDVTGKIEKRRLDVQVDYGVEILIELDGKSTPLPVVGGGGNFKVAVGEKGAIVGYTGNWRPIESIATEVEIISRQEAEAAFEKGAGDLDLVGVDSFLAYYSAPAFEMQRYLSPVWVVTGEARIAGEQVPLRNAIIAASEFGPLWPELEAKKRPRDAAPYKRSLDDDEGRTPSKSGLVEQLSEVLSAVFSPRAAWAQNPFESGTSWIGPSQGLSGSPGNAQGFVDELAGNGWLTNFNWGEAAAFESDWNSNDDSWVDAADFVFYTGHANANGWVLNNPDDTFLNFSEVQSGGGDLYGNSDLEWVIIAACGPHQSNHFVGSVGNAFDRWRGIFDGLHVFLGYGAVTYDNTSEGRRVIELAAAGWNVIDAWFRTAWEIQPSTNGFSAPNGPTVYVTAMYAHMGGNETRDDHIWGAPGPTASDPVGTGQRRTLMWSGT